MKRAVLFLLIVSIGFTQVFSWQDGGFPVRQGAHIEWSRTGDVGDDGYMIFGWSDTRTGNRDVYAQKVDSDGNEVWDGNGLLVVGYEGRQEDPVFISDDNGGVYVIWSDFRNEPISDGQPYAQHISSDGSLTWDVDGVPLSDDKLTEFTLNMCKDGNGGVFAIWKKKSSSHYGSYLNITNSNGPTDEVEVISDEWSHSSPSLETAGVGGAVMVWTDERNADKDIYGQRLGFNGTNVVTEWEAIEGEDGVDNYPKGGIPIVTASGNQSSQKVTYYSEDHTVIVWQDERYSSFPDIFATFLDADGAPASFYGEDGLPIVSSHDADGIQQYADNFQHKKPRVKANENGAYVIWNDFYRPDASGNIYIQKITHENNGVWESSSSLPFDGIPVSEEDGEQSNSRLTVDGNDGVYVVWENSSNEEKDIKIKHLDSDGNSTYDDYGLLISSADNDQISPLVRKDGYGGAFSVWQDHREGSIGLYVQHINGSGIISMLDDGNKLFYGIDYYGQLYNDEDPLQLTPKSLYLGNDQTLLFWEDHRNGNQNVNGVTISTSYVYAELIDGNYGNMETNNGVPLSESPVQSKPSVKSYDNGYLYHFIGQDIDSGENILSLEYLDDNFTSTQDYPVSVDDTDWANQKNFISQYDMDGNLFIIYARELWDPSSIWLQIYDQSGVELLSSPINIVKNSDNQNYYPRELLQNPDGGMLMVYDQNEEDIRVIGIDNDGSYWDGAVSIISNYDGQQFQDAVATDDGIFVTWKDSRNGNNDIYSQHISFEGEILSFSADGVSLCEAANDQSGASVAFVSTTNTVTICWEDFRNGSHWDAYCREMDLNNNVLGDEFVLSDAPGDQMNPFLYTSLTNSILVVWEDFRGDTYEYADIYFQELVNGEESYASNGSVVSDGFHNQVNPKIDILSDQSEISYLIYWDDMRSSGKEDLINVFAQKYISVDCNGIDGGTATLDECGVCDEDVSNDCVQDCNGDWGGNAEEDYCENCEGTCTEGDVTSCAADAEISMDCAGECEGSASLDECGICDEDVSNDCVQDCNGDWGGNAEEDYCENCEGTCTEGDATSCAADAEISMDCAGVCGGGATEDDCDACVSGIFDFCGNCGGTCVEDDTSSCAADAEISMDCAGECGGGASLDQCDVCDEDVSNDCVQDCNGDWGGNAEEDYCENCEGTCTEGDVISCAVDAEISMDCAGECGGSASLDECGVCDEDATNDDVTCTGCLDNTDANGDGTPDASNYDAIMTIPCVDADSDGQPDCCEYPLSIEALIPTEYALAQNYPNPFNPSTVISFSLPEYTQVSLLVYDVNGKVVSTLISDALNPGVYNYKWNGKGNNGQNLPSGIFFYILKTDNYLQKRKMVFIK